MSGDPYLIEGPALISFSGGRTSGYMLKHILDAHGGTLPADVHVVFANTGDEAPETLDFVQECSDRWAVPVTWLEFDPAVEHRTRIVNHNSASRNGEPLDAAIDSRPTPHLYNPVSRYCTGTTKQRRIEKFGRHWCGFDKWASVRGIRADETRRVASMAARSGRDHQTVVLPLADAGVTNADVLAFWRSQPFDLRLPISASGATLGGNCEACVLKKRSTLLEVLAHRPEAADRMIARESRMQERIASLPRRASGPELRDRFFKNGESFENLRRLALSPERPEPDLFSQEESLDCACTD